MNRKRLQLMVTMLTEVIAGTWSPSKVILRRETRKSDIETVFELQTWGKKTSCGYEACAVGHAAIDTRFVKMGLSIYDGLVEFNSNSGHKTGWNAVESFFGIGTFTAECLFMKNACKRVSDTLYETESNVISRIMLLLDLGETEFLNKMRGL